MAKKIEKLIYTNERGESITFSHASIFHTNEVSGLSDVRNEIYSINSMGQDGDTYLGNRIQSREIEIVGSIRERDKDRMRDYRRQMNRVLNPQYSATLTYEYGDFRRVIDCKIDNAPAFTRKAIFQDFTIQLLCLNPFWRKEAKTRDDIATWIGGLEFPVEIPLAEGWEIGYRQPSLIVNKNQCPDNGGCGNLSTEHGGNRHYFRGEFARPDYADQADYKVKGCKYGKIKFLQQRFARSHVQSGGLGGILCFVHRERRFPRPFDGASSRCKRRNEAER